MPPSPCRAFSRFQLARPLAAWQPGITPKPLPQHRLSSVLAAWGPRQSAPFASSFLAAPADKIRKSRKLCQPLRPLAATKLETGSILSDTFEHRAKPLRTRIGSRPEPPRSCGWLAVLVWPAVRRPSCHSPKPGPLADPAELARVQRVSASPPQQAAANAATSDDPVRLPPIEQVTLCRAPSTSRHAAGQRNPWPPGRGIAESHRSADADLVRPVEDSGRTARCHGHAVAVAAHRSQQFGAAERDRGQAVSRIVRQRLRLRRRPTFSGGRP